MTFIFYTIAIVCDILINIVAYPIIMLLGQITQPFIYTLIKKRCKQK